MIVFTNLKNNFLSMSKTARYVYSIFGVFVIILTFQIISAFLTPPTVEKKAETSSDTKGKADIELQSGQSVKNIGTEQSDQMITLASQIDTEQSKEKFKQEGIAVENVQLAPWEDQSKQVSGSEQNNTQAGPETRYILRDPASTRLPDELANVNYELDTNESNSAKVTSSKKSNPKDYIQLNQEEMAQVIKSMSNNLEKSATVQSSTSTGASVNYIQSSLEAYNYEVNKVKPASLIQQEYQEKLAKYASLQNASTNSTGSGFVERQQMMTSGSGNTSAQQNIQNAGSSVSTAANTQVATNQTTQQKADLGRGLLPGDILPCKLVFSINSDLSSVSACEVVRGPLRGAIIGLNVQREEEYVTLTASGITFNDYYETMSGIAISMEAYGTTGIRSDIDRHTLSRWSSLLFAGAFDGIWELYKQPRQRTILTDQGIVQTTEEPSDRQVLLAALSRPASILTKSAEKYFERPNTIYVHRSHLVGIYIQQPFNTEWLPDVSKNSMKIKY
jgi:hypothetical protein